MIKRLITILLIAYSFNAIAQKQISKAVVKQIKEINIITKEVYVFPKVIIPQHKSTADKINEVLLEFLEIKKADVKKSIFENVWEPKNENCAWLYHDLGYKVLLNNATILVIDVWAEFGKHNTTNIEHYLFDIETGNRVKLDSLFEESLKKNFAQILYDKKDSIIKSYLITVEDSLIVHQRNKDTSSLERDNYMLDGYKRCIESHSSSENDLEYVGFYFLNNKLHFNLEQCFCWAANAYDELGDYHFEFTYKELEPYLSAYGKRILRQ